ncbi:MAG: biotin transporter BioY [Clostridia bacterium]|nr:biotin transporter BioY [Clostridia bacterium]
MKKTKGKIIAADIAECAIFVALMSAAAYITIPFPLVPLTFQTVIAVLAGLLLGWKKGLISMSVYCFTGLIGVPVFAAGGGIFYVLKPSFGYILGFILSAAVAGLIAGRKDLPLWRYIVGALAAFVADYLVGIPYCIIAAHLLNVDNLLSLFITGNLIYMPKDAVLSVLAGLLAYKVLPVIDKGRAKLNTQKSK